MKTKIGILVLVLCTSFFNVHAQRRTYTTTRAASNDISDNLDLEAVSSIFGDSKDLEDFEYRLNDPDNRISNLDLNEDGYIDYLRVVENSSDRNSLIVIQAVLDKDIYQDVATIEVERVPNGNPRIQIVGDAYIYGSNYIIEPVFFRTPLIFSFFWGPRYTVWHSPYYWDYYPRWYRYYRPCSPFKYHRHIYGHINYENKYHHTNNRNIHFSGDNYDRIRRSDYATRYPDRAFHNRHQGINNRNELIERRSDRSGNYRQNNSNRRPNSEIRPNRQNSNSDRNEPNRSSNEYRKPNYQKSSGQTQPREYNRNSERSRPEYNRKQEQKRTETYERRSEPQSRPSVNQERSSRRVETQQRSAAPREKSGSVQQSRSRSNSETRQSSKSVQRSESPKKEQKKESRERRREE
jgi:hypothetical protein